MTARHAAPAAQRSTALLDHRPPLPGDFCGILPGLEAPVTDRSSWPGLVKAAALVEPHNRGGKPVPVRTAALSSTAPYRRPLRVTLTQEERAWLGKSVRWSGTVRQVWSLAPTRGHVWLVSDGQAKMAPTLELVAL